MTYPVTNSSMGVRPCQKKITAAKIAASAIQAKLQSHSFAKFYGMGAAVEDAQVQHQHGEDEKIE